MTQKKQNEYVDVYYGIHMGTFEVMSVWVTRGGKMSCGAHTHTIMPGRNIVSELIIVFNIADAVSIRPEDLQKDFAKQIKADLEIKAQEMKKAKLGKK